MKTIFSNNIHEKIPLISIPWRIPPSLYYMRSQQIILWQIMVNESQLHRPRDIHNYCNRGYQRVIRDITPPKHGLECFSKQSRLSHNNIILGHTSHFWNYLWLLFTMLIFMRLYIHQVREPPKQAVCKNTGSV